MSTRPRSRRLLVALSILSEEPTRLIALRADGGVLPLRIVSSDAHALLAHVPADDAREGLTLRLRLRRRDGSGHDIDLAMASAFYHSDGVALARLLVRSVRPANGARAHARTRLDDLALVHVQRLGARVLHTRRAHYGRRRIGCEVLEVTGGDRRLLNTLARRFPAAGSPDQRLDAVRRGT